MKKYFLLFLLLLPLAVPAQVKIGVVNVQEIYALLPEVEVAKQRMKATSGDYQDELESMRMDMQKKYAQYQAVGGTGQAPDEIRKRRIGELQEIDVKIQRFMATAEEALSRVSDELFNPIRKRVADAINRVGAEGGYSVIYGNMSFNPVTDESSAVMQPLYLGPNVEDVTTLVKQALGIIVIEETPAPEATVAPAPEATVAPAPAE